MGDLIAEPWPWYVAGPLIGLVVPLMHWAGGEFGVSENLRHICAAVLPTQNDFFRYELEVEGSLEPDLRPRHRPGGSRGQRLPASAKRGHCHFRRDDRRPSSHRPGDVRRVGARPGLQLGGSGNRPRLRDDGCRRLPRRLRGSVRWWMHVWSCHLGPGEPAAALAARCCGVLRGWPAGDVVHPPVSVVRAQE